MHDNHDLTKLAKALRATVLQVITKAGNGHPGGSLSALDIILTIYKNHLRHNPKEPKWPKRDRFVLSKGHAVPALYAVLAECGYLKKEDLLSLRQLGSPLQGHPANRLLDCIEASTGSLGQGLSVSLGMAMAAKINANEPMYHVYALLGDGEIQEGQVWEAAMCASHYKVGNLIAFIDRNNGQIDGLVDDVMGVEPLKDKWHSFGWQTMVIDGHDYQAINDACNLAKEIHDRPSMIIANTYKGKGVSFLESDTVSWHGKALSDKQLKEALSELLE